MLLLPPRCTVQPANQILASAAADACCCLTIRLRLPHGCYEIRSCILPPTCRHTCSRFSHSTAVPAAAAGVARLAATTPTERVARMCCCPHRTLCPFSGGVGFLQMRDARGGGAARSLSAACGTIAPPAMECCCWPGEAEGHKACVSSSQHGPCGPRQ